MKIYTALISCEDQRGLVHQITGVLFRRNLNVTGNQEYVDHISKKFFMRTEFEGVVDETALRDEFLSYLPKGSLCDVRELTTQKVIVFASGEPHCLGDLLLRHSNNELRAEILAVVSQLDTCSELVERFNLPFLYIPVDGMSRDEHEKKILAAIAKYQADYLILARYMRIFSSEFVGQYPERIVNIHHSFLPAFIGNNPYHQAYERGVKMIGATAHFVTDDLDEGPIISQGAIAVNHTIDPLAMAKRGQDVERTVLAAAVNLVLDNRVLIDGVRTIIFE